MMRPHYPPISYLDKTILVGGWEGGGGGERGCTLKYFFTLYIIWTLYQYNVMWWCRVSSAPHINCISNTVNKGQPNKSQCVWRLNNFSSVRPPPGLPASRLNINEGKTHFCSYFYWELEKMCWIIINIYNSLVVKPSISTYYCGFCWINLFGNHIPRHHQQAGWDPAWHSKILPTGRTVCHNVRHAAAGREMSQCPQPWSC